MTRGRPALWLAALPLGALALTLGWWTKARCLVDGAWDAGEEYLGWCYTDLVPLFHTRGLGLDLVPYLEAPVEYPVLTGLQMWGAAALTTDGPGFLAWTALGGGALLLATIAVLAREGVPWRRLALFAAAPTLVVYAFMNWDAAPVLALVGAIALHRRGRDGWAGLVAGLGTAAKLFPAVVVPLVVLALLRRRRPRAAAFHAAVFLATLLAVNLPVALLAPDRWSEFFTLNATRPADWDSLWFLAEQLRGGAFDLGGLNLASAAAILGGGVILVVAGTRRRPPERWWELALPLLAWFLLANKVYSPQFSLWLLPLLVWLAPPAPLAAFLVADLMVFAVRFPFLGGQAGFDGAPSYGVLGWAVAIRAVVLLWVIVAVTRSPAGPDPAPSPPGLVPARSPATLSVGAPAPRSAPAAGPEPASARVAPWAPAGWVPRSAPRSERRWPWRWPWGSRWRSPWPSGSPSRRRWPGPSAAPGR